jgi:hypothetical protein
MFLQTNQTINTLVLIHIFPQMFLQTLQWNIDINGKPLKYVKGTLIGSHL